MVDAISSSTPVTAETAATLPAERKTSGTFSRIFGGILGGAVSTVAPGAGSLVGAFVRGNSTFADANAMLAQSARNQMQLLSIQMRNEEQNGEFMMATNLMKARHDGEMNAVRNFKS